MQQPKPLASDRGIRGAEAFEGTSPGQANGNRNRSRSAGWRDPSIRIPSRSLQGNRASELQPLNRTRSWDTSSHL